jgi:hypothetical protein
MYMNRKKVTDNTTCGNMETSQAQSDDVTHKQGLRTDDAAFTSMP